MREERQRQEREEEVWSGRGWLDERAEWLMVGERSQALMGEGRKAPVRGRELQQAMELGLVLEAGGWC